MAIYSFFWKTWLRANLLTQDIDNDYIAEVSTTKQTLGGGGSGGGGVVYAPVHRPVYAPVQGSKYGGVV